MHARELGVAAAAIGFDWDDSRGTLAKVAEELAEVTEVFDQPELLAEEIGDLLLAVVNVARHRKVDPESALRHAAVKLQRRVDGVAMLANEQGRDLTAMDEDAITALWAEVKRGE